MADGNKKEPSNWEKTKKFVAGAVDELLAPKPAKPAPPPPPKNEDVGKNINDRRKKEQEVMQSYKKGGTVKKTGPANLHKGERVLTVKQSKSPAIQKAVAKTSSGAKRK